MELLRLLTAGSVDDGKSTLIGRLFYDSGKIPDDRLEAMDVASHKQGNSTLNLALFTDGLKAEREQGITIDVAYRYFDSPTRKFILADSPGHLEYTRNMITAASQSDVALILIDVEKGVSEQTKRHAWICQWLGIRHFAFCVNKMDRIGYAEDRFLSVKKEMESWFQSFSSEVATQFIPMSALTGEGILKNSSNISWYSGPSLMEWLNAVKIKGQKNVSLVRFSVQMMIHPKQATDFEYRGYAGKLNHGNLKIGDSLQLARNGVTLKISKIEKFGRSIPVAESGDLVTLLFEEKVDLSRGDLLFGKESIPSSSRQWEVELCFLQAKAMPISTGFFAHVESFESKAAIQSLDEELDLDSLKWRGSSSVSLDPNKIWKAKLNFQNEVYADPFGSYPGAGRMILIQDPSFDTAAIVLLKKAL